jgi:hypothetical protein
MKKILSIFVLWFIYSGMFIRCQTTLNEIIKDSNTSKVDIHRLYSSYEIDIEPLFPGGRDSLRNFINLNFKLKMEKFDYQGTICLYYTIDTNGEVNSINVAGQTEDFLFGENLRNLCKKMPKWFPGKIKGVNVKTVVSIPFIICWY